MGVRRGDLHGARYETYAEQYHNRAFEKVHLRQTDQYANTHAVLYSPVAVRHLRGI